MLEAGPLRRACRTRRSMLAPCAWACSPIRPASTRTADRTIDVLTMTRKRPFPGLKLKLLFSPNTASTARSTRKASRIRPTHRPAFPSSAFTETSAIPHGTLARSMPSSSTCRCGVRFYTYETVVRYFLEAPRRQAQTLWSSTVPTRSEDAFVQGPLSDAGSESYVNVAPIPVRHGMTLGELARYLNGEYQLHASLSVIAMNGWQRGDSFDATGLTWTNPSPNLRSLREAILYPALGLIETTNISVGRGTDTPFAYVGAPWIDGPALARALNARFLPGVRFVPVDFTPRSPYPYADQLCHGIELIVTDRNVVDSPELGLEIASPYTSSTGQISTKQDRHPARQQERARSPSSRARSSAHRRGLATATTRLQHQAKTLFSLTENLAPTSRSKVRNQLTLCIPSVAGMCLLPNSTTLAPFKPGFRLEWEPQHSTRLLLS